MKSEKIKGENTRACIVTESDKSTNDAVDWDEKVNLANELSRRIKCPVDVGTRIDFRLMNRRRLVLVHVGR